MLNKSESLSHILTTLKGQRELVQSDKRWNDINMDSLLKESINDIRELMQKKENNEFKLLNMNINTLDSLVEFMYEHSISVFLFGKVPNCGIPEEDIILPKRSTLGSAGYDIFSTETFTLKPGESKVVKTGLNVLIGSGMVLMIYPRSGLGFKYKTQLANTVGIIDSDYILSDNYGHIMIKLVNDGDKEFTIMKGDAFAQAICMNYFVTEDDGFTKKEIRNGGFGSTDNDLMKK